MIKFQFELQKASGIHGGMIYIFYLANLLNKNGIESNVLINQYPEWLESGYEHLITSESNKDAIHIVPECFYNGEGIPIVQAPFIKQDLSCARVCLCVTPFIRGILQAQNIKSYYVPIFINQNDYDIDVETKRKNVISKIEMIDPKMKQCYDVLNENFVLSGTHKQIIDGLKDSQCFVYPATYSGLDYPIIEAMACGCIVFAADSLGNTGFIRDGITGYIANNDEEFRKKILTAKKEVGLNARWYIMKYYSDEAVKDEICGVFNKIISEVK
jgi:hypothetical protein